MKRIRSLDCARPILFSFFLLGASVLLAMAIASPPLAQSDSDTAATTASLPSHLQGDVHVMVELKDSPAGVTWAAAYKQAQAQLDAQRNYALQHPNSKTSQALLKKTPTQAQISSTSATQVKSIAQSIDQKQRSILPALTGGNIGGRVMFRTQMAYNGIAMIVSPDKVAAIAAMPGVKAVHPMVPKSLVNTFSDIDFLNTRPAWTTGFFGTHGENIKVADIDTGLDYIHRNFGGSGAAADYASTSDTSAVPNANYPTPKIPGGTDLVGDTYDANPNDPGYQPIPVPDNNPLDCGGHGTATASLIAGFGETNAGFTYSGNYNATDPNITTLKIPPGFAPNAKLYPVRVFGCGGSTDVVVQAIEWAMTAGTGDPANRMDVINMSLGSNFGYADDPDDVAATIASSVGILVCSAAGNAGDSYYIHSSPAAASGTFGVAASFNDQNGFIYNADVTGNSANLTGQDFLAVYSDASPQTSLTGNVVYARPANASTPLTNAAQVAGNIVLIDRGAVTFAVKAANAQAAGASGIIVANNVAGDPFVQGGTSAFTNGPNVMISLTDGNTIKTAAAFDATTGVPVNPTNVTIAPNGGKFVFRSTNPAGTAAGPGSPDTLPTYTSRGPRLPDSATKPDITAPAEVTAVAVSAAERTPIDSSSGNAVENFNGTSSATPHVAGMMALIRQLHPSWSVQEQLALACNTATHDLFTTVGGVGGSQIGVGRIGAGRIDIGKAAAASVVAYNGSDPNLLGVSFGVVEVPVDGSTILTKNITVSNKGATNVTYNTSIANDPALIGGVFTVNPANFTVNAGTSTTATVTFTGTGSSLKHARESSVASTQNGLSRQWLTEAGGYAVFTPTDASPTLRVEVYAAPKPGSSMHATNNGFVPTAPNTGSFTITLSGSPVNTGASLGNGFDILSLVKPFELQHASPLAGQPNAPTDRNKLKYVGVTSDYPNQPSGAGKSLTRVVFGIDRFSASAVPDFRGSDTEICFDTNLNGNMDAAIFLTNAGTGAENVYVPEIVFYDDTKPCFDPNAVVIGASLLTSVRVDDLDASIADTNAYNNSGVVIPLKAFNHLGLIGGAGTGPTIFQYQVVTFDRSGNVVDQTPVLTYDLANPGLETVNSGAVAGVSKTPSAGTFVEPYYYNDVSTNSIPVNYNGTNFQALGSLGVLLMHMHNADGNHSDVVAFRKPTVTSFSPTSGPVGTNVTITGSNFNSGTGVKFLNTPATVTVLTSSTLIAKVPAVSTGLKPIKVFNAAGSSTAPGNFNVTP